MRSGLPCSTRGKNGSSSFGRVFAMPLLPALLFFSSYSTAGDWQLVWSDEFNYTGLPNPQKWDYEAGFNRNEESQWYTRHKLENARVENGLLIIEARKERVINPNYRAGASSWRQNRPYAEYTSASLMTRGKAAWKLGRIEVRAKLPQGKGLWPAIWTLGANIGEVGYPLCGEIDIMEYYGKTPGLVFSNVHYDRHGKRASFPGRVDITGSINEFHVYAIEWDEKKIDFFVDRVKYLSFPVDMSDGASGNPFLKEHYLLINLALGGASGGVIDDSALPAQFLIDYVRIYQWRAASGNQPLPAN
jgi:beta-glucanase (GH16 family)